MYLYSIERVFSHQQVYQMANVGEPRINSRIKNVAEWNSRFSENIFFTVYPRLYRMIFYPSRKPGSFSNNGFPEMFRLIPGFSEQNISIR